MDACRGGGWTVLKDCAGVLYLLEGVCHQMSNRFMFPVSGKYMLYNAGHPKGYSISVAAYGFTGLGFEEWYEGTYLPAAARFGEEAGIPENAPCVTYDMERELAMLQEDVASVFGGLGISVPGSAILDAQKEWLAHREGIMKKYGFMAEDGGRAVPDGLPEEKVRAMTGEVIHAQRIFFAAVCDSIGKDNFRLLNDGEDGIMDIVDVDTALQFYRG